MRTLPWGSPALEDRVGKGPSSTGIIDDQGALVNYARMDRCRSIPPRMAIRKVYTCAVTAGILKMMPSIWRVKVKAAARRR